MQENQILKAGQERLTQAFESKTEKPETLAREMLRQGDMQVTDILGWIDDQETAAMDSGDIALLEELGDIKKAVNEAYAKLRTSLEQAKRETEIDTGDIDIEWETSPAEQGAINNEREIEIIEDEKRIFLKAFETLKRYGSIKAEDVFGIAWNEPEDTVPGLDRVTFAKCVNRFVQRFGEDLLRKIMEDVYEPAEIKEFIELMANTDTPPDPDDFAVDERNRSIPSIVTRYINMYRLLKPGTKEEKSAQIMAVLGEDSPDAQIINQELLERPAQPGERYLEIQVLNVEQDDAEYQLAQELATELPKAASGLNLAAFEGAIFSKDTDSSKAVNALESCLDDPISDEQRQNLERGFGKLNEWLVRLSENEEVLNTSAEAFTIHHEKFNRDRRIPSFKKMLAKKLCIPLVGFLADALKKNISDPVEEALDRLEMLKEKAISTYSEVANIGVPAFRKFTEYIEESAAKHTAGVKTFAEGEFHVGRDTKNTTYVARMARLWGTMSAKERLQSVRFIDVSRLLVKNVPRAVLAEHLRQNGINDQMMGFDGGYRGSSPQDVLLAVMSGDRRKQLLTQQQDVIPELNPQIRLMETSTFSTERSFDPQNEIGGIVNWMESLPKFTERSQTLVRSSGDSLGRYLVLTSKKNISEQMLAWVVQHAVWRELAPRQD